VTRVCIRNIEIFIVGMAASTDKKHSEVVSWPLQVACGALKQLSSEKGKKQQ
jgi:hypothetical protein